MKRTLVASLLAFGGACMLHAQAGCPTGDLIAVPKSDEVVAGELRHFDALSIARSLGRRVVQSLADGRVLVVRPPNGVDLKAYRRMLLESGTFSSVEPNTVAMPTATPNDPSLNSQWHLFQISAPLAWDFQVGTQAPILAVVDGGVDITHPDLVPNLVSGYNTISGLPQSIGGAVSDITTAGHGTRTAGVAAARGNNGVGVSGVGWDLRVMPIRATDNPTGATPLSELLEGVQWAVNNGAKVVSVSYTEVENAAVEAMGAWARTQGALLVWSAGNANTNWSGFDHLDVTVVGGTDQNDAVWYQNSTTGSGKGRGVDVFAPCTQVYTIKKGGGYGNAPAGVSFAVPQVAASLAIMFGRLGNVSPATVEMTLLRRCRDLGPKGNDLTYGWGRLSVGNAVSSLNRKYSISSLPRPVGYSAARLEVMNDVGDAAGVATSFSGAKALVYWRNGQIISLLPVSGNSADNLQLFEMNNQGALVGEFYYNSGGQQVRAFKFTPEAGYTLLNPIGVGPNSFARGINESGVIVGIDGALYSADERAWIWFPGDPQQTYINPQLGFSDALGLNDSNEVIGRLADGSGGNFMFVWDGATTRSLSRTVGLGYSADQGSINENGKAVNAVWLGGLNIQPVSFDTFSSLVDTILIPTPGMTPWDLNNFDEVVGTATQADSNPSNDQAYIIDGYHRGPLTDYLQSALVNPLFGLREIREVNDNGELGGVGADQFGQEVPFIGRPVENPGLAISLGQLGSSPTYIGSIPPTLSVTFTDSLGVPYSGGTVNLDYASSTGRLGLSPPASVTGNYRMYMRCNSSAIPGYAGTNFLNRLYPPLGVPSVPRDASYIPYDGSVTFNDQPILEMYPGDVDGSGEIDAADIDLVIADFGLVNPDPGFGRSDCDGSGEIDAADIDVVIANFGLVGDPEP